jgi:hypothetical protein
MFAQFVAAYARTKPTFVIHDAFISKPFDKWGGLFQCVYRSWWKINVSDSYFFLTVKDGQVDDLAVGTDSCKDLSPFPELMQLIRR